VKIPRCAATVKVRNLPIFSPYFASSERGDEGVFVLKEILTEETQWVVVLPEFVVGGDTAYPETEREPQEIFSRDFDSNLFRIDTPYVEIEHKIASYLGEKLFMPRYEEIRFGYDGSLDPEYVGFMTRSITHWREKGDYQSAYRFEMELNGMKQLASLVSIQVSQDRSTSARHIIGSDPGPTYSTEEGAKSVIFVGEVKRLTPNEIIYGQIAVPLELLTLLTLYEKIRKVADYEKAAELTGVVLPEITAESLVAYAVPLIASLNEVAEEFGQGSWEEIVKKAEDQLRLENDPLAKERRDELVSYYANAIYQALQEGRDREYLNIIDESMRRVFALEAGAKELLGLGAEHVERIVERNLLDVRAEQMGIFAKKATREQIRWFENHYQVSITEIMQYRGWMTTVFRENPLARRALMTGCGGGINIDLNNSPLGGVETWAGGYGYAEPTQSGFDTMTDFGYQANTTESEVLHEGDTACYTCPVCESEGHTPGGEVKLKGGNLVCQRKPDKHYIKYDPQAG